MTILWADAFQWYHMNESFDKDWKYILSNITSSFNNIKKWVKKVFWILDLLNVNNKIEHSNKFDNMDLKAIHALYWIDQDISLDNVITRIKKIVSKNHNIIIDNIESLGEFIFLSDKLWITRECKSILIDVNE